MNETTIEALIGQNIRRFRAAKGWSQSELGDRLAFALGARWAPQQVSQAESGQRAFTAAEMIALAVALEVTVSNLYDPPGSVEVRLPSGEALDSDLFRILAHRPDPTDSNTPSYADYTATINRVEELLVAGARTALDQARNEGLLNPLMRQKVRRSDDDDS